MHGIVEAFGAFIIINGVVAFLVSLMTGFRTLKGALVAAGIFFVGLIAFAIASWSSVEVAVIELPILILGATISLFGALPGAAMGGWLRSRFLRKET